MEEKQTITFERKPDGKLVRKVKSTSPLKMNGDEIGDDETVSIQVLTKDGEKKYRDFGIKLKAELEDNIKRMTSDLKQLKHLGHDELTEAHVDTLSKAVEAYKKDPRTGKAKIENIDKLCGVIFRKLNLKFQLEEQKKKLELANKEFEELNKVG